MTIDQLLAELERQLAERRKRKRKMGDEKMRAEFEDWYNKATDHNGGVAYYTGMDGRYCYGDIEVLWRCWQASRATLVVELPDSFDTYGYSAEVARVATDCCAEAIEAAGVRVTQ